MNILLCTPIFAQHADAGIFFLAALSRHGHRVTVWDHRHEPVCPKVAVDASIVLKGSFDPAMLPPGKKLAYWPDRLGREPHWEQYLPAYDRVFTCLRPTPPAMVWLPGFFDPLLHRPDPRLARHFIMLYGTHTDNKEKVLQSLIPENPTMPHLPLIIFGNGWPERLHTNPPVYMHALVAMLSGALVSINVHRDPGVGLNRRLFESAACAPTLTDDVPGAREVVPEEMIYSSTQDLRMKIEYLLGDPKRMLDMYQRGRAAIAPYTYEQGVQRMLTEV